ncbi:hypothetical protein DSAG12_00262 [Promethearchaeum syntrophicum]|uniref:Uncharacterized protein n=1 Tax=Promethearchaeum syntrophicum TaxID=2594042 RepID=A0A5B9D5Q4_9ARCH|nr:hypothetical protein [Candidatus Prometheoarchaeum syntrophicum]
MTILFEWTNIDWIKWMPVEIAVLLFLIILIRIIRRLTRWGPVKISHVKEGVWDYDGKKYHTYYKSNPLENIEKLNEKSHNENKILLIPTLMDKIIKGNHLATAITMLGHEIILLDHKHMHDLCKDQMNSENNSRDFEKFLLEGGFSTVILFDWSIFPIFKSLGFYDNHSINQDLLNISWILIRPTLKWSDIKSIWKMIPFTGIWFSKLRFLIFQKKFYKKIKPAFKNGSNNSRKRDNSIILDNSQRNFLFIQPSNSWLSKEGEKNLEDYQKKYFKVLKEDIFQFSHGNWSFFRNETMVLGIIIQEILKKDRKKKVKNLNRTNY